MHINIISELDSNNFTRVHNIIRVESRLQAPHDRYTRGPVLLLHQQDLTPAHPVLPGARTPHTDRQPSQPRGYPPCPLQPLRVSRPHEEEAVEVPVSHVSDNRRQAARPADLLLDLQQHLCEGGDGDTHVGGQHLSPGHQRSGRVESPVASSPKPAPLLGLCRPLEISAVVIFGDLFGCLCLLTDRAARAMELEK